ncbi:hypothetical protein PR202_gb05583 [Eleusine coracana subsp. coracana]|uniref:Protein kinase domain-containing protein n=1 Tax=Eleusine coracana subsp. coracana TaxID=191504 RepID=A0AAV5E896_ELECO|nr:hypothetical protein PR202_gb05583 [Eleusine coracana subsp. coracana]
MRLSDLEEICHLGAGASGVVTKVHHRPTGAVFALKTTFFPDRGVDDDEQTEAEALRRSAGSPHVVRCHAVLADPDENVLAYVLELMDAGTLGAILKKRGNRGLPEPALAEAAARCLDGLAHLHARGVAHLDVNPDNLLVNAKGDVKVGDLSESRTFLDRAGAARRVHVAVGKTAYMSPERFAPVGAREGPRGAAAADVWGLGVTVLELFTGRRAFLPAAERPQYADLRRAICDGEVPAVPEGSSPELRGFVAACLQKDPRRRATVTQLQAHPFVARRDVEESRRAMREIVAETKKE